MTKVEDQVEDEGFGDLPVKGTKPIVEAYHRCDLAVLKPAIFEEAVVDQASWKGQVRMLERDDWSQQHGGQGGVLKIR